jgi:hypothetical protein
MTAIGRFPDPGALPTGRQKFPKKRRGDATRFNSAARCGACGRPALNEKNRKWYSAQFGYELPAGLCLEHVQQHAAKFHGITPTWHFENAQLCGKLTSSSRYTLPCKLPRIRGQNGELLGSCQFHGAKGAEHGHKGAQYGHLAWEKVRAPQDGTYRDQPKFKNVRVKKGSRPSEQQSYAHLISRPRPQPQPVRPRTLSDLDQQFYARPKKLRPLYEA